MSILVAINYDPTTAVTKSTTSTLALTQFDTTNLRAVFTVPGTGAVLVRIQCTIHGATTVPQILLGVLQGSTVIHRQAPKVSGARVAATDLNVAEALFVVSGLTPGTSKTWDASYAVETVVASSAIKYGGGNNATANDAFGAIIYEVWEA